jgi:hypothetical protein
VGVLHRDVLHRDEGSVVLRHGRAVVQSRRGVLTEAALDAVHSTLEGMRAENAVPIALLVVLERDAPPPPPKLRERMRRFLPEIADTPDVWTAIVVAPGGMSASLMRGAQIPTGRVHSASTVERACRWLTTATGVVATELRTALDAARAYHDR